MVTSILYVEKDEAVCAHCLHKGMICSSSVVVEQVDDMNTFYKNLTAHLRETLPRIDAGEFFGETSEKNLRFEMKKSYNNECTGDAPGAVGWVTFACLYCSIFRVWCKYSLYTPLFPI